MPTKMRRNVREPAHLKLPMLISRPRLASPKNAQLQRARRGKKRRRRALLCVQQKKNHEAQPRAPVIFDRPLPVVARKGLPTSAGKNAASVNSHVLKAF